MEVLSYSMKWLELTLRWGHVLFAILWVGNSFLFNYLDNKLPKNLKEKDIKKIIFERTKIYSMAHHKINCEKFSKNEIVKEILNIYNEN